ncbi:PepSY domain-containing protein [Silanimonas sp.]|uniref:PepSY domain-containing protein n=1 Tax=Silanimonas sp. TaxID=1929290 RepID=UPI0022C34E78|nr:PepSY domain-containing protein [Silanimonas sp.]MCZ8164765.1 PepSY domain-containing protein [Silanimonas sp.]
MPARFATLPFASRLHRALAWVALVVLVAWTLSGFLHPLMGLLAPMPVQRSLPSTALAPDGLVGGLPAVLRESDGAAVVRTVPGPGGTLWQRTGPDGERRYHRMDGSPWPGSDRDYARWLAATYLGEERAIRSIEHVDRFSADYPWVNRLLPVWAVSFEGDDGLIAYVHTETGVLASLSDARRRWMQAGFRQVHTLAFLGALDPLRRTMVAAAMTVLLALGLAGLVLWWRRPGSPKAPSARRWHRRLALWAGLPLLGMAASGLIHTLWKAGDAPDRGLSLPAALVLPPIGIDATLVTPALVPSEGGRAWSQASVATLPDGRAVLVLREPLAPGWGVPVPEARVVDLASGTNVAEGERALASAASARHGVAGETLRRVTRFGPEYDFRNRRLPAWIATTADGRRIAFDPDTAQRLDAMSVTAVAEAWVFSIVHKWQPLAGLLGSPGRRDALQVAVLALGLVLAGFGIALRRRRRVTPSSVSP